MVRQISDYLGREAPPYCKLCDIEGPLTRSKNNLLKNSWYLGTELETQQHIAAETFRKLLLKRKIFSLSSRKYTNFLLYK